ncbi:MAG: response regulator [Planctomycetota bacterium]
MNIALPGSGVPAALMQTIRVLHLDDSRVAQRLLAQVLEPVGEFAGAETLAEALALVREQEFSAFVVDFELPDGDGLEFVRALRADPRTASAPILLYCASLNESLAYEAMQAGVNESFAKPMHMLDLRDHVLRHIETPTHKRVTRSLIQFTVVAWQAGGRSHLYSPDLDLHVAADDPEAAADRMDQRLEALGEQMIDPSCAADPARPSLHKVVVRSGARPEAA